MAIRYWFSQLLQNNWSYPHFNLLYPWCITQPQMNEDMPISSLLKWTAFFHASLLTCLFFVVYHGHQQMQLLQLSLVWLVFGVASILPIYCADPLSCLLWLLFLRELDRTVDRCRSMRYDTLDTVSYWGHSVPWWIISSLLYSRY